MKKASTGVKRLLVYGIVILCILFVGFLTYYFAKNGEKITYNLEEGVVVYMNKGEQMALPIVHEDADKDTKIEVMVSDSNVLTYSESTLTFVAVKGGLASVTISTTNKHFGPYRFDVMVGEGSISNPYYISSANQLEKIGKNPTAEDAWKLTDSFELINDIDLQPLYSEDAFWTPIGTESNPFAGRFVGNGHKISNLIVKSGSELGLFGSVASSATVDSVVVENALLEFDGSQNLTSAGILAGSNYGNISRVTVSGKIDVQNIEWVGGLVGINGFKSASASLTNVEANINFVGNASNFGGICGQNVAGVIFNADAYLDVEKTDETKCGGLIVSNQAKEPVAGVNNYTRPIVKNTYAYINTLNTTQQVASFVYENKELTNEYAVVNLYVSNYAYCGSNPGLVKTGKATLKPTEIETKTKEQLQEHSTFAGWDFDNTWVMNVLPHIDVNANAVYHGEWIPGSDLTTKSEVENAVKRMIENPSASITYNVKSTDEIVIDCKELRAGADWTPIGTYETPFKGILIVDKDTKLTFTNLVISSYFEYSGFFGVTENAVIQNVKFTNVKMTKASDSPAGAGTVAARVISTIIEDCQFDNIVIKQYNTAGFVVANMSGSSSITNCHVGKNDVENINSLENSLNCESLYYGGIVAVAKDSSISNTSVDNSTIVSTASVNSVFFGGIAGHITNTTLQDGYNIACNIEDGQSNISWIGGIAGVVGDNAKLQHSYNLGQIQASTTNSSYAGGVAGSNARSGIVQTSFSQTPKVQANYVGGIVALNEGILTESYSDGEYRGFDIGGLAYKNTGKITNCYTWASLVGLGSGKNHFVAGFAAYLPEGGSVELCFSTASLSGDCSLFAETSARIRYTGFGNFFSGIVGNYKPGTLDNCVVVNYGNAEVQKPLIIDTKKSWVACTDDDCRGRTTTDPFAIAGFTTKAVGIWEFVSGEYPTLTNVVKIDA